MSESLNAEELLEILDGLPSVAWSSRIDPSTMTSEWVYVSPRVSELYGVSEEDLRGNTLALVKHTEPGDGARLQQLMATSLRTLAPLNWTGRVILPSGGTRWIETQILFRREPGGTVRSYGMAFDVTERMKTEQLHRQVIDALPAGVIVMTPDGQIPVYNRASFKYGGGALEERGRDLTRRFELFKTDGVTRYPDEERPLMRALRGEAHDAHLIIRNTHLEEDLWAHSKGTPIFDEAGNLVAGLVVFHDISTQHALDEELRQRNAQLAESEQAKSVLIERLRYAIDELSNPILEVWDDVLVMPIIGIVDSRRTSDMVQRLLIEVARAQASFVIIDLTGVEIVDTRTADHLIKLVRKVELVGARCVLTGVRPAVSEALVGIGVDFGRITTLRNLKHGLREALRLQGAVVSSARRRG